ncbi:MAG TPA: hypothetical protein VMA35_13515 [Candidatus Sulfopaludibacter sp.]|nr:hypothetical protein [Candidatus Sulfopaludibacter sp.]
MSVPSEESVFAWEPFTPRGVAAFARVGLGRLLLVQFLVALLAAGAVVWFADKIGFPAVAASIRKLPPTGEIRAGRLAWPGHSPELLATGRILALDVDLDHSGQIGPTADLQIEFGRETIRSFSLFGYWEWHYPRDEVIAFNRNTLEPLWGAWAMELLILVGVAAVVGCLLSWWLLAALYFLPLWLLGFYANRDLSFRQSWRLAGAALIPGAVLMAVAVFLYGLGFLNLVSFGFIFGAHFVIGWIYLFVSLLFVPRAPTITNRGNPFKIRTK